MLERFGWRVEFALEMASIVLLDIVRGFLCLRWLSVVVALSASSPAASALYWNNVKSNTSSPSCIVAVSCRRRTIGK